MPLLTDIRAALSLLHAGEITHYLHDEIARLLTAALAEIDRLERLVSERPPAPAPSPAPTPTFATPEPHDVNPNHQAP